MPSGKVLNRKHRRSSEALGQFRVLGVDEIEES